MPLLKEKMPSSPEFLVLCLCAEWCGSCREYRPIFEALAERFPEARFRWVDIEEHADDLGDLDVENFPTLLIQGRGQTLFYGTMLPYASHLQRLIEVFRAQTVEQSAEYAHAQAERAAWQENDDLQNLLRLSSEV